MSTKKKLITSALPYVNNEPHLGNIIGCVLSADVYARFCRSKGYETLYICGTDEYGTATEHKAVQEGLTPREICDKYHAVHKAVYADFNISFDAFGRTSDPEHTQVVQEFYADVVKNDYVVEQESEQFYSESLKKFLADRFIKGTCPKCGYIDARGDQCDGCGSLLTPTELIEPKSSLDGSVPILKKTKHRFLDLTKISEKLKAFQDGIMAQAKWPVNAETTTKSWMDRGLEPRAITRDLKWGVPVPEKGFEEKVFYVWFDAPIGYVSITKKAFPDIWLDWWQNPENVNLYQFMAKDNIPFHSVMFPATQIASGKEWTKVHHLNSTEYLTYEGDKFSKSQGKGVFGSDVKKSGIPIDLWRFYLIFNRPEKQDTSFDWDDFYEKVNSEFIDNVGNLVNRSLVYCSKNFESLCPSVVYHEDHEKFIHEIHTLQKVATEAFENVKMRDGIREVLAISRAGNKFFQDQEPWVKIKEDKDYVAGTVSVLIHLVKDLAVLLEPVMPETSARIFKMLNSEALGWHSIGDFNFMKGKALGNPEILFQKLDQKEAEEMRRKFGNADADPWKKVEIKAGKVLSVEKHPNADHLYVEKIDVGEDQPRTIVSALVKHLGEQDLQGKTVMVVTNLPKAEFAGIESEGMLLCAAKKKKFELVVLPEECVGKQVNRHGEDVYAQKELIDINTFKEIKLKTIEGQICCEDQVLEIEGVPLKTETLLNAKIA